MAQYRYAGPGPIETPITVGTGLIRPGDVWEFAEEPTFGPWDLIEDGGAEKPSDAPETATGSKTQADAETASTDASASSSKES